jgi:Tol biopolymer transport system component
MTADFETIALISAASGHFTRVRAPGGLLDLKADLSPDGRKIAAGAIDGIWVFSRNGGGARRIVHAARTESAPWGASWSPTGRELVFVWDEHLFTVRADGKNVKKLFYGRASAPDWSPAGDVIVFVRRPAAGTGAGVIHSIEPDGSNLRAIAWGGHPDISPDGSKLAIARPHGVYVMPMTGGKPKLVIRNAENPEWSPSGRYLAFTRFVRCSEAGCTGRVFVARATGGPARSMDPRIFDIGPLSWSR